MVEMTTDHNVLATHNARGAELEVGQNSPGPPPPLPPREFSPNMTTWQQANVHRMRSAGFLDARGSKPAAVFSRAGSELSGRKVSRSSRRRVQTAGGGSAPGPGDADDDTASEASGGRHSMASSLAWNDLPEHYNYDSDEADGGSASSPKHRGDAGTAAALSRLTHEQRAYHWACVLLGAEPPATAIMAALPTAAIVCRHRVLGPTGARALAEVLRNNITVRTLDLSDNNVGADGADHVCATLAVNHYITHLTLSENHLGSAGLRHVVRALRGNVNIISLDISGNDFKDVDGAKIAEMLQDNICLKELNVSHNALCERGGTLLAPGISQNDSLRRLDLSWNHLRRTGAVAIADALMRNTGLQSVNLAWNGFAAVGCLALRHMLTANRTLRDLDLSANRVDKAAGLDLCRGLVNNKALETLTLRQNPITSTCAIALIDHLERVPRVHIRTVDISGQTVDEKFMKRRDALHKNKGVNIVHGAVLTQAMKVDAPDDSMVCLNDNPLTVLMEYMRILNLRPIDLFTSLDTDSSWSLSSDELRQGLVRARIPLSPEGIDRLIKTLDADGDGEVDFGELQSGSKEHKRMVLRWNLDNPGIPFEESDVGRVNIKLQAIMTYRQMEERVENEKHDGRCEELSNMMEDLKMQLTRSTSGLETLQMVKRTQSKFKSINAVKGAVSAVNKVMSLVAGADQHRKKSVGGGDVKTLLKKSSIGEVTAKTRKGQSANGDGSVSMLKEVNANVKTSKKGKKLSVAETSSLLAKNKDNIDKASENLVFSTPSPKLRLGSSIMSQKLKHMRDRVPAGS